MSDFRTSTTTLEQREDIPRASWELPSDELCVRLGCSGCANAVCFTAKGVTSEVPEFSSNPDDVRDLRDTIGEIGEKETVFRGFSEGGPGACESGNGTCPDGEAIEVVIDLLNDRFGSDINIKGTA